MSKNVTLITYPEGTILKSYDTFVAIKPTASAADNMVTEEYYSKTTSRHISEFFSGADFIKVPQTTMDTLVNFLEAYHS